MTEEKRIQRLWVIQYDIKRVGRGVAVVKAYTPNDAIAILKSSGTFNSCSYAYEITCVEEINISPNPMILAEVVVNDFLQMN